jgi:hypothetical protein
MTINESRRLSKAVEFFEIDCRRFKPAYFTNS